MEEAVDADIAEADAEDEDEEAADMDEAGDMGEEFDLVRVVAKWFGKGLVVDAHVVACEDDDKDGGEETDLCTVRDMAKVEQSQSSSL